LKNLQRKFERFCFQHQDKGIPNLMLYLVIGTGMVYFFNLLNGGSFISEFLVFDKAKILQGQVWRLFTWLFTDVLSSNPLLNILFLYFFYRLGQSVEMTIGTFKFNLFYAVGVVMMDLFALIFCPVEDVVIGHYLVSAEQFSYIYGDMAYYLHLAMVLAYATSYPDARFLIFYVIPVPAWVLGIVYLVLVGVSVFNMCYPVNLLPHALFPLIGLLNYFLFFGGDMRNLLPLSWRSKLKRKKAQPHRQPMPGKPIPFPNGTRPAAPATKADYNHKCTICGRTDVTNPELEFRYCSRCNGYHCYCEDHISNHNHIE
jgi:membrane associated rhomboid family serine protease